MKKFYNKWADFKNDISYDEVYAYYILENHPKTECYEYFNTTERIFRAFLEHYNIKKPRRLVTELSNNTKMSRYGSIKYNNPEQRIKTCLEKFGSTSPLGNKKIYEATQQKTKLKHNGKTGFGIKTIEERKEIAKKANSIMWNKFHTDADFAQKYLAAQFVTKKKNKTFNTSKKEQVIYDELCKKYGSDDVLTQYWDSRYPFRCDFYIKSLDLFIELNAHWTHGDHPFNSSNEEDQQKLSLWQEKAKTSKFFNNAIETWTKRDPKKLNYLISNKLNFILMYNTLEVTAHDYKY